MSADYIQANTDGRLHPADLPSVSPLNRGFLYGDAIYEVWRTFEGAVFAFEEHWERLEQSAEALHIQLPLGKERLLEELRRTVAAFAVRVSDLSDLYLRLQITRGAGAIGLNTALADKAGFVILVQTLKNWPEEKWKHGLRLGLATKLRRNHVDTLNPAWKTGNYLNNILCLREAMARGADEVLMTNLAGEITEAAVSNVFFVRNGEVITPPLSAGILAGITRRFILEQVAPACGIPAREQSIRVDELNSFEECFVTSTTRDIVPVGAMDETRYRVGEGTVTRRLKAGFADLMRQYVERHPELYILSIRNA
jgi:branched-chain amino acid aminotransferase